MRLKRYHLRHKETVAAVIAEEKYFRVAEAEVLFQRMVLEDYIRHDPFFLHTLKPYAVPPEAPEIVRRMAEASSAAGVGPMASVAGAIAYFAVRAMVREGARQVIFENGGDIALFVSQPVLISLYAGERVKNLAFRVRPRASIFGVCTSSGKMGHSLSFGQADAVTVIASDPILADALATAAGNEVKAEEAGKLEEIINRYLRSGAEGILVVVGELIGLGGHLPELINAPTPYELITTF